MPESKESKIERITKNVIGKTILAMPFVFSENQYAFRFFSVDLKEALHVHVEKDKRSAKFWIQDDTFGLQNQPADFWVNQSHLAKNNGMKGFEITEIKEIIANRKQEIINKWIEKKDNKK